jgi:hypothetical protein
LITSARQAAAVCGVTRFAVRAWIDHGLLSEPPWTVQQLRQVGDTAESRPGPQAQHRTRARWSHGCDCVQCRQAQNDTGRAYGRAKAQYRLPWRCGSSSSPPSMPADRSGRRSVIEDLARGDLIHTEIARKYGRSVQGIRQFSSRNHTEVSRRRAVLQGELNAATADQWVTEKAQLGDLYWKHYEDLDARISNPDIDDRTVKALTREATAIIYKYSELMGHLPPRTSKVEVARSVLTDFDVISIDEAGGFSSVTDG